MSDELFFVRHACHVVADHFVRSQSWLAAGVEADQHARNDRAIRLYFDPIGVFADEMPASKDVLKKAEEDLDRIARFVEHGDDFSWNIKLIGSDPKNAITRARPSVALSV